MATKERVGFAGEGWGAIVAVKSLKQYFAIECISTDEAILALLDEEDQLLSSFEDLTCKIVIAAGYKPIIPNRLLEKHQFINVHYSLLPKYRGLHSTAWAIMNNEPELGLTVHLMNEFIDDGPILYQHRVANDFKSTAASYMTQFNEHVGEQLGAIVHNFYHGNIQPQAQDKAQATWVGKRSDKHNRLDFTKGHAFIKCLFRVLAPPYPLPFIEHKGRRYRVQEVGYHNANVETDIGRILNVDNEGIWVKSQDGYIILKNLLNEKDEPIPYKKFKIGHYLNNA